MRPIRLVAAVLILLSATPSFAQEWIEYVSRSDLFSVTFPGQPKVQDIKYTSEYDAIFPGRVYTHDDGPKHFSVTVVDYTDAEQLHKERAKACPPDAQSACAGSGTMGVGSWLVDLHGAIDFAAWRFMKRDAKLTFYGWHYIDLIGGRQLQLTNNADQSRTFVSVYMHLSRLYILEATVPKGVPQPAFFQQNLSFLDKDGKGVRYETIYTEGYPTPRRSR